MSIFKLRDYQQAASDAGIEYFTSKLSENQIQVLPTGCHGEGTLIRMWDNSLKKVEDIKVGDRVMNPFGGFNTVIELHQGKDYMFYITPATHKPRVINLHHNLAFFNMKKFIFSSVSFCDFLTQEKRRTGDRLYKPVEVNGIKTPSKVRSVTFMDKNVYTYTFTSKYKGYEDYFGFELDGNKLYMDEDYIVHHNSGKSLIIADIANKLGNVLVFQPRKEILEQNYAKYISYGNNAAIYSASIGRKDIGSVTFATIGTVINNPEPFMDFKYIIHDECHDGTNPKGGNYADFYRKSKAKVLGLTATPYRLSVDGFGGAMLKFLTRTKPRIFSNINFYVQVRELLERGYLNKVEYYCLGVIDSSRLVLNSSGTDYTDSSVKRLYEEIRFNDNIVGTIERLKNAGRKRILVFTRFVDEAYYIASHFDTARVVTGETKKEEREQIISDFKRGIINEVINVTVLSVGFDYPELDTVVMGRVTRSLSMYYQILGRVLRIAPNKPVSWFVDMGDNFYRFGKVEDLELVYNKMWYIKGNIPKLVEIDGKKYLEYRTKQLTNIYL